MNLKFFVGKTIDRGIQYFVNHHFRFLAMIPNGRYLSLDLKRSHHSIQTIFDVGANIGQTCFTFAEAFPNAKIYSFEPVQPVYQQLVKNTAGLKNVYCFPFALGNSNEEIAITSNKDTEINSLKKIAPSTDPTALAITVKQGKKVCEEIHVREIDLLKLDVEGYEVQVLEGFGKDFLREQVKFIYAETGFNNADPLKTYYSTLESYLSGCGFITSGFYDPSRWGRSKLTLGFCNVLFTNSRLLTNDFN